MLGCGLGTSRLAKETVEQAFKISPDCQLIRVLLGAGESDPPSDPLAGRIGVAESPRANARETHRGSDPNRETL